MTPIVVAAAGALGRGLDGEHTAAGLDRHILDRHTPEEAEAARRTAVDTAIGWGGLGSNQRSGQDVPATIRHETGRDTRHSLHSHSPPELAANSAKEELGNWTCSWTTDYHHDLPESSSLES